MNSPFEPFGTYIVAMPDEINKESASGLTFMESSVEKPKTATVVAVGEDTKKVKVGQRVIYKPYSTTEVTDKKVEYILVQEEDILASVK